MINHQFFGDSLCSDKKQSMSLGLSDQKYGNFPFPLIDPLDLRHFQHGN